jgi:hypothetical protein
VHGADRRGTAHHALGRAVHAGFARITSGDARAISGSAISIVAAHASVPGRARDAWWSRSTFTPTLESKTREAGRNAAALAAAHRRDLDDTAREHDERDNR